MNLVKTLLAAAATLGVLATIGSAQADPAKLRIAWIVPAGDAPLALLGRPGIAQHQGKSYALEFTHFTSTPSMITAIASGQVDLVPFAYSSFALAVQVALDSQRRKFVGYHAHLPARRIRGASIAAVLQNFRGRLRFIAVAERAGSHSLDLNALAQKIRRAFGPIRRNDDPSSGDGVFA